MVQCTLCNKPDSDDSKDGIPLHRTCWYSWLVQTHDNDVDAAVEGLHELVKQMSLIRHRSLNHHKDIRF